jgi:threonine dehydrogenase-like Zn-dependent dehydrogenase
VIVADALLVDGSLERRLGTRELLPGPGQTLVAVEWAGVCGSDLHVLRTGDWVVDWPATLGHEIYGRVAAAEGDGALPPGTPVVADSRVPCGACAGCRRHPSRCTSLQFVGEAFPGGFASHCVLPNDLVHPVAAEVPGSTAVLAEPLAVALHALAHLTATPERMAIIGHGPIGALVHVEARRRWPQCRIDVAEPAELRARLARALGADTAAAAEELTPAGYDAVIDAAGYATSLDDAIGLCGPAGHVLLVALAHADTAVRPRELVERRLRITGVHAFVDELPEAIGLLAAESWRYAPVVTDAVSLRELPDALGRLLESPDVVKLVMHP